MPQQRTHLTVLAWICIGLPTAALAESWDSDEAWERAAQEAEQIEQARNVNLGELEFLEERPEGRVPRMENHIHVTRESLEDGWAFLEQCHYDLDAVPATQVVYNEDRVREIAITDHSAIESATVVENTVQLENVERDAYLCVRNETKAVEQADDAFIVRSGPFMRRFLDGFYPMDITLTVSWEDGLLNLQSTQPEAQPGFAVNPDNDSVVINALFEGKLNTELTFSTP